MHHYPIISAKSFLPALKACVFLTAIYVIGTELGHTLAAILTGAAGPKLTGSPLVDLARSPFMQSAVALIALFEVGHDLGRRGPRRRHAAVVGLAAFCILVVFGVQLGTSFSNVFIRYAEAFADFDAFIVRVSSEEKGIGEIFSSSITANSIVASTAFRYHYREYMNTRRNGELMA